MPPTTEAIALARTAAPEKRMGPFRRLMRDPQAIITASILTVIVLAGILAPILAPHGPNDADVYAVNAPIGTPGHPLGGDGEGRDILSRLLYSINTSTVSAIIGTGVAVLVGVTFGLVGGYFGSRTRATTEWIFNLLMTFPGMLLLIMLMPVTGGDYRVTMLIFGVLLSPGIYRIVRNAVLGVKEELYVDAARVSGLTTSRILFRHVLVVVRGPVIIAAAFMAGAAIGLQSGLAFLGVGSKDIPSFGAMIASGFQNLYLAPMQFVWPSILLGLMTASLVLLGNSLRDAFEGSRPVASKMGAGQRVATTTTPSAVVGGDGPVLRVSDLGIAYPQPDGSVVEVVKGVTFDLERGETLGLVGESGSGKTQTAFAVLGVLPNEAIITSGSILFEGRELLGLDDRQMSALRGRAIAYVPQEPMSNLDPSYTIGSQLIESLRATQRVSRAEAKERILALLDRCGIADPHRAFGSYPHEISGGMAQRVLIAGAVASRPKLLIADEPTTALDVTVQAEILDLLRELQGELGMAVLLVTHNFGVVADSCTSLAVMRSGEIVETGKTIDVFRAPTHEYTVGLLDSILDEDKVREELTPTAEEMVR
ncbi:peptide/nickel transport system permease protein [Microbacterium terrae]|uniref:Oligopeptide transport ATP-binding protein OppD n=2 Tax=Microbacterium terrae TaxID=69369 RepID=A0A0M2H1V8_9MICO|nr:dipeptide/oligopeptide/nickel ABC transporter permease/ATP-binding protein [Microbacterium terrae]KJL37548.1 Oligopeptide transport ATP-binding protein OppD [Microbacterium terrae]MBP1076378.1 peptide/nickel transport system permease protein [Microbacterium terrae]